jgi:hypothetical protein
MRGSASIPGNKCPEMFRTNIDMTRKLIGSCQFQHEKASLHQRIIRASFETRHKWRRITL